MFAAIGAKSIVSAKLGVANTSLAGTKAAVAKTSLAGTKAVTKTSLNGVVTKTSLAGVAGPDGCVPPLPGEPTFPHPDFPGPNEPFFRTSAQFGPCTIGPNGHGGIEIKCPMP